ncbi:MAG: hypothetical protein AAFX50_11965, partial [Acidobacteriota bacterium]
PAAESTAAVPPTGRPRPAAEAAPRRVDASSITEELPAFVPTLRRPTAGRPRYGCFLRTILTVFFEDERGEPAPRRVADAFQHELRNLTLEMEARHLEEGASHVLLFERPRQAVGCALACQAHVGRLDAPVRLRMGLHVGEVTLSDSGSRLQAMGTALDVARDLGSLAWPGQTVATPEVYSLARRSLREQPLADATPRWFGHGRYFLDRLDEAVELWVLAANEASSRLLPHDGPRGRRLIALPQEDSGAVRAQPRSEPPS